VAARFRFHESLSAFLKPERRDRVFSYAPARAATLKNAIEALGVPHTEVGAVTVNGAPATLQRIVREGDEIEVLAVEPEEPFPVRFLADAHLGGLARFLRMLGFDTLHENAYTDDEIRRLAAEDRRIVLTRDRELLKCGDIARGHYVRAVKAERQIAEIAARYRLGDRAQPFSLCLRCNRPLEPVDRTEIAARVPGKVLHLHDRFTRCPGCERIYWPGSHYARMQAALQEIGL